MRRNGLTIRQEKFCIAYARTGKLIDAMKEAGYSTKQSSVNGDKFLKTPKIAKRIRELMQEYKTEKIADIQEIQERLTAIIRDEDFEEVLNVVNQGQYSEIQKTKKKAYLADKIKALTELAKMQGAYTERVQMDIMPVVIKDDLE